MAEKLALTLSATILAVLALAISAFAFFFASEAARAATGDAVIPVTLFGLPLFDGFRHDGLFGVHPQWGVAAMVVIVVASLAVLAVLGRRGLAR